MVSLELPHQNTFFFILEFIQKYCNCSVINKIKIKKCGTKTKLKQFINLEIMVLKKSNVKWDPESRQDVDSMYDLISITAIL